MFSSKPLFLIFSKDTTQSQNLRNEIPSSIPTHPSNLASTQPPLSVNASLNNIPLTINSNNASSTHKNIDPAQFEINKKLFNQFQSRLAEAKSLQQEQPYLKDTSGNLLYDVTPLAAFVPIFKEYFESGNYQPSAEPIPSQNVQQTKTELITAQKVQQQQQQQIKPPNPTHIFHQPVSVVESASLAKISSETAKPLRGEKKQEEVPASVKKSSGSDDVVRRVEALEGGLSYLVDHGDQSLGDKGFTIDTSGITSHLPTSISLPIAPTLNTTNLPNLNLPMLDVSKKITQVLVHIKDTISQAGPIAIPLTAVLGVLNYLAHNYVTMESNKRAAASLGDACIDIAGALEAAGKAPDFVDRGIDRLTKLLNEIQGYLKKTFGDDIGSENDGEKRKLKLMERMKDLKKKGGVFLNSGSIERELIEFREKLIQMTTFLQLGVSTWSNNLISAMSTNVNEILSRVNGNDEKLDVILDKLEKGMVRNKDIEAHENDIISIVLKIQEEMVTLRQELKLHNTDVVIDQGRVDEMESKIRRKASKVVGKSVMDKVQSWMLAEGSCKWDTSQVLGRGANATVYVGEFRRRMVAVKVFNGGDNISWQEIIDIKIAKEVIAWQNVSGICDHVVSLMGFSVMKEKFIVMELCGNKDSRGYLRKLKNRKPEQWVLALIRVLHETALGLHAMHENKILHRDIKGPNILIRDDGSVAIGDFGLGRDITMTLTRQTNSDTSGSLNWMAPERLTTSDDHLKDFKSDVWSFGMVVYELLFDVVPLSRVPDVRAKLMNWGEGGVGIEKPPYCEEIHEYHEDLWDLVLLCVQRDPSKRPDMGAVLKRFDVINRRVKTLERSGLMSD
ncbi:STE20/SPS1- proline-alanine-rich protein kinase [Blyttiomyces sp. JEL0837]|nr:STE20/SPS1- proline-alanine-rich protein kinase [Blyttiomyces sp. JEL0837]